MARTVGDGAHGVDGRFSGRASVCFHPISLRRRDRIEQKQGGKDGKGPEETESVEIQFPSDSPMPHFLQSQGTRSVLMFSSGAVLFPGGWSLL